MSYLDATVNVYTNAALEPNVGLCCTTTPVWTLPGLDIPSKMLSMNYGCGSTVHPRDLVNNPKILYVGVGGGMELLQFAYFSRNEGAITGVDIVPEMIEACHDNFKLAEQKNEWFDAKFINLKLGNAMELPATNESIDVAAQNCLFNIFNQDDLKKALKEMYRVLKPYGRLILSDPICNQEMPKALKENDHLRALCLSGSLPLKEYIKLLTDVGFGTIEIRAKRPYRILDPHHFEVPENIYIESIEVCAIKDPMPEDGPCVFTGKTAIYYGTADSFDDKRGHFMLRNQPIAVCDKTAQNLSAMDGEKIYVSESTWFYDGGGCC